jgi:hypothetical protein
VDGSELLLVLVLPLLEEFTDEVLADKEEEVDPFILILVSHVHHCRPACKTWAFTCFESAVSSRRTIRESSKADAFASGNQTTHEIY